ncbi:LysR family transcriptional regulator [Aquamicrobium sp. LC103]|uniref:LysR family transcriptional regulator n=1 Tax=Aquamicrobium sp. LC103 TaxID=1120658 RepID=UPI00063E9D9F|nr:LysR family transcriptional regulator [Aquamicrobium sp. LC103]TKT69505.1 LysR family transcriptional regulator [Aquamicrobium sp. LC103]
MELDDLDGVVAFLKVASTRNFTEAARSFGVTRSALSQTVSKLESRLGVPLLTRTTRSVGLTEAGQQFVTNAGPLVDGTLRALLAVRELSSEPKGLLRINLPRVAMPIVIEPIMQDFANIYPNVSLEIFVDDGFADLSREGFDAGIRLGEMLEADMVAVRLTPPLRLSVVGSPDYFARHGRPTTAEDLRFHRCIQFRGSSSGELYRWEFEREGEELKVAVKGSLIVNESNAKIFAATQGLGLAYELDELVDGFVRSGQLERVLEDITPSSPGFYLYYPSRTHVMPKLRALIDFLKARWRA